MSASPRPLRLDQLLSRFGYCSRSEARAWLRRGRVTVGGIAASDPAARAHASEVLIDQQPVENPESLLALFHKPAGLVCSHDADEGPSVYDGLPSRWLRRNPRVTSVGRLDKDATGLLVLTDDGNLVHRWTSPRHEVPKIYEVTLDMDVEPEWVAVFASGTLQLESETTACLPARLEMVSAREARLEITEGRYHQVKRMFASQGARVIRLHRTRFGPFELGTLAPGEWRILPAPDAG